jgi:ABC-type polysaccharide/polyol phosphate export permease
MNELLKKSVTLSFFDLKLKNQRTHLGFFWYFLQPLFMFAILFYVKQVVVKADIENFVPYLLIGVMMVHFFISSTSLMMNSVIGKYSLLNSIKIDPQIFILSKFFLSLWNHLFEVGVSILILALLGYYQIFLYLLILPFYALFVYGVGNIICVTSTKFFDATYIWGYFCQVLWFVTPIYYVAENFNIIVRYNPIFYFLDTARNLAYNFGHLNYNFVIVSLLLSVTSFLIGHLIFNHYKYSLTERVF